MPGLSEVGAYEAKTHLPELLRRVREGGSYLITQRGEPVAELVPVGASRRLQGVDAARRMRDFMPAEPVPGIDIRALLDDGRD